MTYNLSNKIEQFSRLLAYINEEDTVVKAEILKGILGDWDEAAEYAVKHTKYSPGKRESKPIWV